MPMILRDFIFHTEDTMTCFCPYFLVNGQNMNIAQNHRQYITILSTTSFQNYLIWHHIFFPNKLMRSSLIFNKQKSIFCFCFGGQGQRVENYIYQYESYTACTTFLLPAVLMFSIRSLDFFILCICYSFPPYFY